MNVWVYGVCNHKQWQWEITLDVRADFLFWHKRLQNDSQLTVLEPSLSIGQAIWLQSQLNLRNSKAAEYSIPRWNKEIELVWENGPYRGANQAAPFQLTLIKKGKSDDIGSKASFSGKVKESEALWAAMEGRSLLVEEWIQLQQTLSIQWSDTDRLYHLQMAYLQGQISLSQGIKRAESSAWGKAAIQHQCQRCGSSQEQMHWSYCHQCRELCPYCEECLTMGRVRSCSILIRGKAAGADGAYPAKNNTIPLSVNWKEHLADRWGLSPAQTEASLAGMQFLAQGQQGAHQSAFNKQRLRGRTADRCRFLIWAVTGAGKTEMIFPLLEFGLHRGQRVAVVTPRKDVVLELAPRIKKAFPDHSLVTLYGGSPERWEKGDITLATTHQLLRFRHSFHLVVIDELDAFPYHNNPMLQYAAKEVVASGGHTLFLSATPPQAMQREARWGKLPHVRVPVRYHRYPLPVPRLMRIRPLSYYLDRKQLPIGLYQVLSESLARGAQLFLFISKIKWVEPFVAILKEAFPQTVIAGTASTDPERAEKVIAFRKRKITMLVTTTILERGVTVPKTDVFILNADAALFDEASLVQMAGRAGRSKDDPNGRVFFIASDVTQSQKGAIRQIKAMNRIAKRKGYLVQSIHEKGRSL